MLYIKSNGRSIPVDLTLVKYTLSSSIIALVTSTAVSTMLIVHYGVKSVSTVSAIGVGIGFPSVIIHYLLKNISVKEL